MNYYQYPEDWKSLQFNASKLLQECGYNTVVEKLITTVRGNIEVDIYVENNTIIPKSTYLIECKYWENPLPQSVIHAFRTVVSDYGANHGFIISKVGFQKGSFAATKNTNIELLTWEEFLELFKENWKERVFWRMFNKFNNIAFYLGKYKGNTCTRKDLNDSIEKLGISKKEEYFAYLSEVQKLQINMATFPNLILNIKNGLVKYPFRRDLVGCINVYENESQLYDEIITKQNEILATFDRVFNYKFRVNEGI